MSRIPVSELVSCAFSTIPICPFLIQRSFSFTCLHSFFTCFHVYYTIVSRQLETELTHDPWVNVHSTLTYSVLLATVLTEVATVSSPQFSHVILPVGSGSCTRFELSLMELYATCEIHTALLRYSRSYESKPRGVSILWFSGVALQG